MRSKKIILKKDTRVELRLTQEHYDYLEYLSNYHNCSIQSIIRMLIDSEYVKFKYKEREHEHT